MMDSVKAYRLWSWYGNQLNTVAMVVALDPERRVGGSGVGKGCPAAPEACSWGLVFGQLSLVGFRYCKVPQMAGTGGAMSNQEGSPMNHILESLMELTGWLKIMSESAQMLLLCLSFLLLCVIFCSPNAIPGKEFFLGLNTHNI